MIVSFACKKTQRLFVDGEAAKEWRAFQGVAFRKLDIIDAAVTLKDLLAPPGNRLEALKGDRNGQHSIRINDQWRVCFVWTAEGPSQVEIIDNH